MKFLILAALVAAASGQFRDGAIQFANLGSVAGVRSNYVEAPFVVSNRQYSAGFAPVYSAYRQQPAVYSQQYVRPAVYSQQYTAQPVYDQYNQYNQYYRQVAAEPVYNQYRQYETQQYVAKPAVYRQQYSAQPAFAAVKQQQVAEYASSYSGPQWRILSQVQEADPTGPYRYSYATENGIQAQEQGSLVPAADGQAAIAAQGSYSYTGPDGQAYTVNYVADENGFRAAGDHLPTPPPIPAEIARSLELNAREERGEQRYDDNGRLLFKKK